MATNPETVDPFAPPPGGDAASHAQGRVAIREYLRQNKGKATVKGVTDLAATFGLTFSKENEPVIKLAVEWANREDTDVDLLQITTDPLAPATGNPAQTEIIPPGFVPTPELAPTPLEAFYTGAADVFAREPSLGLDPENRQYVESLGLLGRSLYAPLGDIGAGALTTIQAGLEGTGLAAGQLMEDVGLLYLIEQATGVKQTPEYAQRQFLGMLESEGLRAPMGYVPPGYAVATGQVPVSASRMAQALERAEPLPLTAPPPTPMARIAQAPEIPPTRITPRILPRAAAAAPETAPPSLPSFSPRPLSGEEVAARAGILQGEKKNRVSDLSQYAPRIYRETDFDSFRGFLPWEDFSLTNTPFGAFVADTPDMALGQGSNRGVLLEFDAEGVRGRVNERKPAWQVGFGEGLGSEFYVSVDGVAQLKKNLRAIRIADEAQAPSRFITERRLKEAGWVATRGDGFTEYTRPVPAAAAPKPFDPVRDLPTAPVDEIPSATIPDPVRITPEQRAIDAAALDAAPPEELRNILRPVKQKEILRYQGDYAAELAKMGIFRPKKMPLTEFIQAHMLADTVPDNVRVALMKKHGIRSSEDQLRAAGVSRESLRRAAQDLNLASQLERQLERLFLADPELAKKFGASKEALRRLQSPYHRMLGIESGALTTQMSTVMRNLLGAGFIMPTYNLLVELGDVGMRAARNINRAPEDMIQGPGLADVLYSFWDQFAGTWASLGRSGLESGLNAPSTAFNKIRVLTGQKPWTEEDSSFMREIRIPKTRRAKQKDEFMEAFRAALPNKYNKLFGRWASDQPLPRGDTTTLLGKSLNKVENAVEFINLPNIIVDRATKNAQFMSILEMEAKRAGIDIQRLFREGRLRELKDSDVVDKAVRLMHKRVFEDRPEGSEWYDSPSRAAITLMNYTTRPLGMTPFPNFWISAFKHIAEQNPLILLALPWSKAQRAAFAKGDHRAVTKVMAGLATTMVYYFMKDPDDGTKWYEFKIGDTPVDMSAAFAPHLPSMLQAHLLHLREQGRLNEFDWGADLGKVLGSSNLRAGVGQYAVDEGISEVIRAAETGDTEGAKRVGEEWARNRASGLPVFFRNFRDLFDPEQATVNRDPQTIGQEFATNFPRGTQIYEALTDEEIPLRYAPTRAEATQSGDPRLRQLTGALIREPRNKLEELVVDLGMNNSDLYTRSGLSDTYDRLMVQEIGRLTEQKIGDSAPLLERVARNFDKLKNQPPEEVRPKVRKEYSKLRSIARDILARQMPIYKSAGYYDSLSADEKIQQDKKDIANPKKGRTFREFFREVEEAGIRATTFTEAQRQDIPSGTTYADLPTYSIRVKP